MDAPERAWKSAAFSQYPRGEAMGYSMRTPRYRYTEWLEPGKEPLGVELYDHVVDPGETANLAARYPEIIRKMETWFQETRTESALYPISTSG